MSKYRKQYTFKDHFWGAVFALLIVYCIGSLILQLRGVVPWGIGGLLF